ncbi:hypothetical protein MYO4S_00096 [Serratia phage 4S]|nr:hypothetical protein MYO4S_00096 [Serratia phage 4S]
MKYYRLVRVGPFRNEHCNNGNIARFIGATGLIMTVSENAGEAGGISSFKNIKGEMMANIISRVELKNFFIEVPEEIFKDASWRAALPSGHFAGSRAVTQNKSLSTVKELKELTFNTTITKDNYKQAIAEIEKAFK